MALELSHTRSEAINSHVNSRSLKYGKKKVNSIPSIVNTAVNKSKVASSESLPLKQDQIVKTKFTVTNELKHKVRKNKGTHEPIIDTPEFKLLCKLFVPSKYLIHNDKIAIKQLSNHLPLIIPGDIELNKPRQRLNFELHLFLSSIVTHYITSWYLSKLNTDNLDFIRNVYNMLSEFSKDFIKRLDCMFLNGLFALINELCVILNDHIKEIASDSTSTHDIKLLDDYLKNNINRNTIKNSYKDENEIMEQYLTSKHVIFENRGIQMPVETTLGIQQSEDYRIQYFRLIAKELLTVSFNSDINYDATSSASPSTSHITMSLLIILVADLILDNIFKKISSPQFVLQTILNDSFDMINESLYKKENDELENKQGLRTIRSVIYSGYKNITRIMISMQLISEVYEPGNSTNILENCLFQLIDTITNFSTRKPLLASVFQFMKRIILANKRTSRMFDSFCKWFLYNQLARILNDEFGCKLLKTLREGIFEDNDDENDDENNEEHKINIDSLTSKIYEFFSNQLPNSIFCGSTVVNSFKFSDESDDDFKSSIHKFLLIFNYNVSSMDNNLINEACLLNQLLIIQWIDCILSTLYPELVNKQANS